MLPQRKINEVLAHSFAFNNNIPTIGLRFFTVYGPKGRPDMAYFKFADLIGNQKKIIVFITREKCLESYDIHRRHRYSWTK